MNSKLFEFNLSCQWNLLMGGILTSHDWILHCPLLHLGGSRLSLNSTPWTEMDWFPQTGIPTKPKLWWTALILKEKPSTGDSQNSFKQHKYSVWTSVSDSEDSTWLGNQGQFKNTMSWGTSGNLCGVESFKGKGSWGFFFSVLEVSRVMQIKNKIYVRTLLH